MALRLAALAIAGVTACSSSAGPVLPSVSPVSTRTGEPRPIATTPVESSPSLPPSGLPAGPSASPTQTLRSPRVLTEADRGAVVELSVGSHVLLQLGPASGNWISPTLSSDALRIVSSTGGYPSTQTLKVDLLAVGAGTVSLDDTTDDACFHQSPRCLRPQGDLHIVVNIS